MDDPKLSQDPDVPESEAIDAEPVDAEPGETGAAVRETRAAPPSTTHQEARYLRHLIESQIPVEVRMRNGEIAAGVVEYFDTRFVRLTRADQPNLFIFKQDILYIAEKGSAGGE